MRALRHRLLWLSLAVCLTAAVFQSWQLYRIHRENVWIAELAAGRDIGLDKLVGAAPEVRLARAAYLRHKQRYDEALDTLSLIVGQGDNGLSSLSRYNLGNVYLAQAQAEIDSGRIERAMPLLTLAKQSYRLALRQDPGFWDAKYNLELAMRLLPEFDRIVGGDPDDDAAPPSQLWTTVPGFPRGLP